MFTYLQRIRLREILEKDPNPTVAFRWQLATEMGVNLYQINNWFRNNRRSKNINEESVQNDTPLIPEETGKID